jgi:hypothetical protein
MSVESKLSILIPSCDKYKSLLPHTISWIRNIPTLASLPLCVSSNSFAYKFTDVNCISTGFQRSWSAELLIALKQVETEYLLIILDDLISSSSNVNESCLEKFIGLALGLSFDYLCLVDPRYKLIATTKTDLLAQAIPVNYPYRLSLLPAIWKKTSLICLLRVSESAWEFERNGSKRSRKYQKWMISSGTVIGTSNLIIKGKINASNLGLTDIEENQLDFPKQSRIESFIFSLNVLKHNLLLRVMHVFFKFSDFHSRP